MLEHVLPIIVNRNDLQDVKSERLMSENEPLMIPMDEHLPSKLLENCPNLT
jgi:hypothetical protein